MLTCNKLVKVFVSFYFHDSYFRFVAHVPVFRNMDIDCNFFFTTDYSLFRHGADLVSYLFGGKLDVVLVVSQKTAKSLRLSSLLSNHTINLLM